MEKDYFLLLVTKKIISNITEDEERLLQQELESNEAHRAEYSQLIGFWDKNSLLPAGLEQKLAEVWAGIDKNAAPVIKSEFEKEEKKKFPFWRILKAAVIIVSVAVGTSLLVVNLREKKAGPAARIAASIIKQTSDINKAFTQLADGTKVWLNHKSRISYNADFGIHKREIVLTGEAFFDVAKNEKIPLIIHAQNIDIKVKGTAFNVCAYKENRFIETALVRGLIEVINKNEPDRIIQVKPNEKLIIPQQTAGIKPGSTTADGLLQQQPYIIESLNREPSSNLLPETSWMENKLIFYREPFAQLAARMERWYGVEIILDNEEIASQKFSGAFDKETAGEALSALQLSYHFNYRMNGNKIWITQ